MKSRYALFLFIPFLLASCGSSKPVILASQPHQTPPVSVPATPSVVPTQMVIPSAVPTRAPTQTVVPSVVPTSAPTHTVQQGYLSPLEAEHVIAQTAQQAILALKDKDMGKLAQMAHPEKGLTFSPYAAPHENSITWKAEELSDKLHDTTIYSWGHYDGTGAPIDLPFAAYYDRFVYSNDFAHAPQIAYNQIIGGPFKGSSLDMYGSNIILVEYHFPGFDPKYEGMDWRSLLLIFQETDQRWYLVTIAHDEWGI